MNQPWTDPLETNLMLNTPELWRGSCWLAQFSESSCDFGPPDPHHLILQQRIRKAHPNRPELLRDPRIIRPVCRQHHDLFHRGALRLSLEDYPASVHEFAAEYGFIFHDHSGWVEGFACAIDEEGY